MRYLVYFVVSVFLAGCVWQETESNPDYLPMNDGEYPYAGLPRLVVETEDYKDIKDHETEHPAKFQIYGEHGPVSPVYDAHLKGRGNTSFSTMAKYSMKLILEEDMELFGMPADNDWDLISNFADRTFLRNQISYKVAKMLGEPYAVQGEFVELYLNREYMGIYQVTEHIKAGKNRVNISKNGTAVLAEISTKNGEKNVVRLDSDRPIKIHYPHNTTDSIVTEFQNFMNDFERYLRKSSFLLDTAFDKWIDEEAYLRFYWIQEFGRNTDSYYLSTFFTWERGGVIRMGPTWDMDVAYGHPDNGLMYTGWLKRGRAWNPRFFANEAFRKRAVQYWKDHRKDFASLVDTVDVYAKVLRKVAENDFKKWPILTTTQNWMYYETYDSYDDAVETLKTWIRNRVKWIDENLE